MKNLSYILFVGLIIFFQNNPLSAQKPAFEQSHIKDSLTNALNEIYQQGHIHGFSVAIVNQSGILYQHGFGHSNLKAETRYTENTIQNIASISKTLIGVALLKAHEMGKLNLDDPVNEYLPFSVHNPHFPKQPITIRHLATHTSTIVDTDYYDEKVYILKDKVTDTLIEGISETLNPPNTKISLSEFLSEILHEDGIWYKKDGFLNYRPGEKFEYSNIGATLAALVLESATGQSYDTFATEHILNPLGMSSSGWSFEQINMLEHSKLYAKNEKELPYYSLITYPDGGLITSANDLGKFLSELIKGHMGQGTLLTKKSYKELFRKQLSAKHFDERDKNEKYNDEYNSGIFMGHGGNGNIGHTGFDPGVASLMFFNPKTKIGKLLIINTTITSMDGLKQFYSIMDKLGEYENRLGK